MVILAASLSYGKIGFAMTWEKMQPSAKNKKMPSLKVTISKHWTPDPVSSDMSKEKLRHKEKK